MNQKPSLTPQGSWNETALLCSKPQAALQIFTPKCPLAKPFHALMGVHHWTRACFIATFTPSNHKWAGFSFEFQHLLSSSFFYFFRPHCYEKYQLLKSHFPQKIFESCLITSLPPYFFKTVLPASRTRRKHKEKVLYKWGMFFGTACKALPCSHIIILLYFFCCCWSVSKGLDLPCSSNSNLKNIPSSNRDALGCTWDVLGIPALSRNSTAKPCREEVKLPRSPHKKATLL